MTLRRYAPMKPSRGTVIPPRIRVAVYERDQGCVAARAGITAGSCAGNIELDHVRGSGGMGMKSRSTSDNLVMLCGTHHLLKTEHGRLIRPLLLDYLARVNA